MAEAGINIHVNDVALIHNCSPNNQWIRANKDGWRPPDIAESENLLLWRNLFILQGGIDFFQQSRLVKIYKLSLVLLYPLKPTRTVSDARGGC